MKGKVSLMFFLPNYFGQCRGGAELQTYLLLDKAKNTNLSCQYCFITNGNEYAKKSDITFYEIKKSRLATKLGNVKFPYAYKLLATLKKAKPAYIYQRGASVFTGVASYYGKKSDTKTVYHIASDSDVDRSLQDKGLLQKLDRWITDYGITNSKMIIAQTSIQEQLLLKYYNRSADAVIANGQEFPSYCSKDTNVTNVVWVANWKKTKQPELFVQLAKKLSFLSNVNFIMIGRNNNYPNLVKEAESIGIKVLGELSNDDVNKKLEAAHLLVNTSVNEGFSNTFIQAWGRNVPVISLNADPDDVIKKHGLGACSNSMESMIDDVKSFIEDSRKRKIVGDKSRDYAISNLSLDNLSKIMELITS